MTVVPVGSVLANGTFYPGWDPSLQPALPFGTGKVINVHYSSNFANCGHSGYTPCHQLYDFAVMRLDSNFQQHLQFEYSAQAINATLDSCSICAVPATRLATDGAPKRPCLPLI